MYRTFKSLLIVALSFIIMPANAQSDGGETSGSGLFCAGQGFGFVSLTNYNGNITSWEYTTDSVNWIPTGSCCTTPFAYLALTQTTCYRAIVQDGSFPPDTSTFSCIQIFPASEGGTISGDGTFCANPGTGAGALTLNNSVGDVLYWEFSTDGGNTWTNIPDSSTTHNYTNFTQDRLYRAVVQSGSTCPTDTSDTASFTFDPVTIAGILSASDTVCPGINNGTLTLSGSTGAILNWQSSTDGSSWTAISNTTVTETYSGLTQTTRYEVIVKNGVCPADTSNTVILSIIPNNVDAGIDTSIALGSSIDLTGIGNGTALWTPSAGLDSVTSFTPTATPTVTTTYTLTVTDNNSCIETDSVTITIYTLEYDGMVANLFTPNGDGINDTWYVQNILNFPENEVFIYNIYGNLVYQKKGYTNDWDGTYNNAPLPDGTYYFVLKFTDPKELIIKGSVDILKNK